MERILKNRRKLVVSITALGLALAACSGSSEEGGDEEGLSGQIVLADYGGTTNEIRQSEFFDDFYEETGVEVVSVSLEPSIVQRMLEGKEGDYDVFQAIPSDMYLYHDAIADIPADAQGDLVPEDLRSKVLGGFYLGTTQAWLTDTYPDGGPQNWEDFFDVEKFPGKRAWPGTPGSLDASFEIALLADGVPEDELYPLDIERAVKKLDTIRDHLTFYQSYPEVQQLLSSGSVAIGVTATGMFNHLQRAGLDVTIQWNDAFLMLNGFVFPEKGTNPDAVQALATWMRDPERQARFVEETFYGPVNSDVFDLLPDEIADDIVNSPAHVESMIEFDEQWRAEHDAEMVDAYTAWLAD